MLQVLDAAAIRRWADACVELLDARRAELDRINVFPVPDSDTGTNLLLTVRAGAEALGRGRCGRAGRAGTDTAAEAAVALANGAVRGARGNSGVIVSQLFRGLAEVLVGNGSAGLGGPPLAGALRRADELARAAVSRPVEGTVLSVLRSAADSSASAAERGGGLADVAAAAADGARGALADTPRQLPVLARAGVVDAGGYGVALLLAALAAVATGGPVTEPVSGEWRHGTPRHSPGRDRDALVAEREGGSTEFEYEVMYLLANSSPAAVAGLRSRLDELGDSVVVVGLSDPDGGLWNVHVHCTDVGAAIEAGIAAGRPHRVTVVRFAEAAERAAQFASGGRFARARAVVAVVVGERVAELIRADGVSALVLTPGRLPGATEIAAVIAGTRARHVVLLPNDVELNAVAEEAAELARAAGQEPVVVPTSSVLQGLAALAVHDPQRRSDDDVVAMAEAAAATRTGVVQVATGEALTWVGRCQAGDVLGLVDGEVVLIGTDLAEGARQLVDRMLTIGGELVTVLLGDDGPAGLGELLEGHLSRTRPEVEVVLYGGGPVDRPLQLGVE